MSSRFGDIVALVLTVVALANCLLHIPHAERPPYTATQLAQIVNIFEVAIAQAHSIFDQVWPLMQYM